MIPSSFSPFQRGLGGLPGLLSPPPRCGCPLQGTSWDSFWRLPAPPFPFLSGNSACSHLQIPFYPLITDLPLLEGRSTSLDQKIFLVVDCRPVISLDVNFSFLSPTPIFHLPSPFLSFWTINFSLLSPPDPQRDVRSIVFVFIPFRLPCSPPYRVLMQLRYRYGLAI